MPSLPGAEVLASERSEIAPRRVADQDDIPAMTAVAAVGPALRNVRLAAKRHDAVSPTPAFYVDLGSVVEHEG
jgi:hypothetical protein